MKMDRRQIEVKTRIEEKRNSKTKQKSDEVWQR